MKLNDLKKTQPKVVISARVSSNIFLYIRRNKIHVAKLIENEIKKIQRRSGS